jgi:asparagine synthase (glutamine-hydrolysing)
MTSKDDAPQKWYTRDWEDYEAVKDNPTSIEDLGKGT